MRNYPHPEAVKRTYQLVSPQEFDLLITQSCIEPEAIPNTEIQFGTLHNGKRIYCIKTMVGTCQS